MLPGTRARVNFHKEGQAGISWGGIALLPTRLTHHGVCYYYLRRVEVDDGVRQGERKLGQLVSGVDKS